MKKLFLTILCAFWLLFCFNNPTWAISVGDFTPALDKKVAKMKTTEEKVKFLQTFADLLAEPTFTKDKNARLFADLRQYTLNMLNVFQHQLKEEKSEKTSTKTSTKSQTVTSQNAPETIKLPHLSDNFSNIDEQKVRDAILSWHNDERSNVWVKWYKYSLDLEWSATTWANKLASSRKTTNLHLRNEWDWKYSYNSILNWFLDLWINFPASVKWASSFSESIWYWYYKCSKSDCTQDLIDSVKKTRTWLIMKEKSYKGEHYRAATLWHFTQMWAWIAIDKSNNRYYIVLHYGVEF